MIAALQGLSSFYLVDFFFEPVTIEIYCRFRLLFQEKLDLNLSPFSLCSSLSWLLASHFPFISSQFMFLRPQYFFQGNIILITTLFDAFYFIFLLIVLICIYYTMLDSGERGHSCFVPDLRRKGLNTSPLRITCECFL